MLPADRQTRMIYGFCAFLVLLLAVQAVLPDTDPKIEIPEPTTACVGEPIVIPQAYEGTVVDPWTCRVQCDDGKRRFILYSNGRATQCDTLPGCNDWGEDNGITCTPPNATPVTSVGARSGS